MATGRTQHQFPPPTRHPAGPSHGPPSHHPFLVPAPGAGSHLPGRQSRWRGATPCPQNWGTRCVKKHQHLFDRPAPRAANAQQPSWHTECQGAMTSCRGRLQSIWTCLPFLGNWPLTAITAPGRDRGESRLFQSFAGVRIGLFLLLLS